MCVCASVCVYVVPTPAEEIQGEHTVSGKALRENVRETVFPDTQRRLDVHRRIVAGERRKKRIYNTVFVSSVPK
jgi:hypothetical protein